MTQIKVLKCKSSGSNLEAVVSNDCYESDDGVHNCQAGQSGLHISGTLFQEKIHRTSLIIIILTSILSSRALKVLPRAFRQPRAFKHTWAIKLITNRRSIRYLENKKKWRLKNSLNRNILFYFYIYVHLKLKLLWGMPFWIKQTFKHKHM